MDDRGCVLYLGVKYEIVDFPNAGGMLLLGLMFGAFNCTVYMLVSFMSKVCACEV